MKAGLMDTEDDAWDHLVPCLANKYILKGFPVLLPTPCPFWAAGKACVEAGSGELGIDIQTNLLALAQHVFCMCYHCSLVLEPPILIATQF